MKAPSRITQSLDSTNWVTSSRPIAPSYMPANSGCRSLMTLLPRIVLTMGMPAPSARASSLSCRPKRWISTSAMITGQRAAAIRPAASATASASASGSLAAGRTGVVYGPSGTTWTMSRGSSI